MSLEGGRRGALSISSPYEIFVKGYPLPTKNCIFEKNCFGQK
jgi:hypothetical protein